MSLSQILIIVAAVLALLDIILGTRGVGRAWYLTPAAVILICIAIAIGSGAIHG